MVATALGVATTALSTQARADEPAAKADATATPPAPPAVEEALKRSESGPTIPLDRATPAAPSSTPAARLVIAHQGLERIIGATSAQGSAGAGDARAVAPPKSVAAPAVSRPHRNPTSAVSPSDARVIASLTPAFAACASKGAPPSASAVISLQVTPTGDVESARIVTATGVSADAASCFAGALGGAKFGAGKGATLQILVRPRDFKR